MLLHNHNRGPGSIEIGKITPLNLRGLQYQLYLSIRHTDNSTRILSMSTLEFIYDGTEL